MRWVSFIIGIFYCFIAAAQTESASFRSYSTREGLSNNWVQCILQDSRQFLWVGTKEGLCRFDGHNFKKYYIPQNTANGPGGNFIYSLFEYKQGQLLIGTNNGLCVLNTLTGKFESERISFDQLRLGSAATVYNISKTPEGQLLINHNGEFDILDSNLNYQYRLSDLPWAKVLKGSIIYENGQIDKQHRLWICSDTTGIQIIDFPNKQVWNYKNNPAKLSFLDYKYSFIRSLYLDEENNTVWYAPWGYGLIRHDLSTHEEQRQAFGVPKLSEIGSVNAVVSKDNQYLLCGIGAFLYQLDKRSMTYAPVVEKNVIMLTKTPDKQIWVASAQGLTQLGNADPVYKELSLSKQFISGECTGIVNTRSGKIYATYENNTMYVVERDRVHFSTYTIPGASNIILTEVCEDKQGRMWIGTNHGIYFFDTTAKKIVQSPLVTNEVKDIAVNVVFCDSKGDVWIGTRAPFNLYRYDMKLNSFEKIQNDVVDHFRDLYGNSRVSRIAEDKWNNLWMTSYLGGGILNYNRQTGQWKTLPGNKRYNNIIVEKGINTLHVDDNHNLWLSSDYGYGLMQYNSLTDSLKNITRADGLVSDYILNVAADNSKNLWITNEYGITQFNMNSQKSVSYNIGNSPFSKQLYIENLYDPVSNSLIYTVLNSWLFIAIDDLPKDNASVVPVIDKVVVNNKEMFVDPALEKPGFSNDENNIAIDFTGVEYSNVHKLFFAYQLAGLDTGWRISDANRSAMYANLSPGSYTFKIKTANESGKWSGVYDSFKFTIRPVFWKTWWFRLLFVAAIVSLIFWLIRRRISNIRIKQKIAETEMMALRSQMNPHFIFNCLNAIDNLIQTNQADRATTYLARFAKLIRSVLESSKTNLVPFHKDFETLRLFLELEQLRSNNKFIFTLDADLELLEGDYKVPPLIIQPFLENAIHHGLLNKEGNDKRITVNAMLENNYIKYSIRDNGVGRVRAEELKKMNKPEHQSYGIQITSERIHLHNEGERIEGVTITDLKEGTSVEVRIKIS